jgi:GntR family transcriptional repressor for pyruvate dehydrogenase complex
MAGDAVRARAAAEAHIDFVAAAIGEAERSGDRERVSTLRLRQRSQGKTGTRRTTEDAETIE